MKVFINWWMDKQNMAYPYKEIFGHEKKWDAAICYIDEPWKHAKWKKLVIKDHMLYDSIYMKCPEYADL